MRALFQVVLASVSGLLRSRLSLQAEILALRHQLAVYDRTCRRPRIRREDRILWSWLSRIWPGWRESLAMVQPATVIAWRRRKFREHWRRLTQRGMPGRPAVSREVRDLIRRMSAANPLWGSPRIMGELHMIGIELAKSTVEKYMVKRSKPPSHNFHGTRDTAAGNTDFNSPEYDPDLRVEAASNIWKRVKQCTYGRSDPPRPTDLELVQRALNDEPVGECINFADLFAGLTRSIGLPTRLIYGDIKWTWDEHAWTETYLGDASPHVFDEDLWNLYDASSELRNDKSYYETVEGWDFNWVRAEMVRMAHGSIKPMHGCDPDCFQGTDCEACRVAAEDPEGGEPWGSCMREITIEYDMGKSQMLTSARSKGDDSDMLTLTLKAPSMATTGIPFVVDLIVVNESASPVDSLIAYVQTRTWISDPVDLFVTDEPIRYLATLDPGACPARSG